MKQQAKGQGTIVFLPDRGRYRAFYTTPAGQRISKTCKTKKDASAWLAQQQAAVSTNNFTEPSSVTVGAWLLTWLKDYKQGTVSTRTFERYVELAGKCNPISDLKLQSLTPPHVQALYRQLGENISQTTINKVHKILKASLDKAVILGLLPKNIMDAVESPSFERSHEIITFTRSEVDALLATAKDYTGGKYYALILLAITSGMRLGELLALRFCDINTRTQEVSISRNLQQTKKGIVVNPPKTKAGKRIISVPPDVITQLQAIRAGRKIISLDDFIFTTKNGTPFEPRNIERVWKTIATRAGIPYRNFHVLRHTHCTDLLAAGVPIVEVARRVGHARISHTLELYGHAIPRYDKEIAAKVGNLYLVK